MSRFINNQYISIDFWHHPQDSRTEVLRTQQAANCTSGTTQHYNRFSNSTYGQELSACTLPKINKI